MKTQLLVTMTQSGAEPMSPSQLERDLRAVVRHAFASSANRVSVRHVVEDADQVAPDTTSAAIGAARAELIALGWTPPPVDAAHMVLVDRRAVWDKIRDAHLAGQNRGRLVGTERWNTAADHANEAVLAWPELRGEAPPAPGPLACTYPTCNCPIDAPSDPSWCARGLPRLSEGPAK